MVPGALSDTQREAGRVIEEAFRSAGLTPPRVDEVLTNDRERTRMYRYLIDQGVLIAAEVTTRNRSANPAIAFHRSNIDEAVEKLRGHFGTEGFTASSAKNQLGISRKYLIPLLEAMDALGATRRDGDYRTVSNRS